VKRSNQKCGTFGIYHDGTRSVALRNKPTLDTMLSAGAIPSPSLRTAKTTRAFGHVFLHHQLFVKKTGRNASRGIKAIGVLHMSITSLEPMSPCTYVTHYFKCPGMLRAAVK
jgi:hypothetical protein